MGFAERTTDQERANFGRRIAAQLGAPAPPGVNWAAYGADAAQRIGKGLPPPDLAKYAPAAAPALHIVSEPSPSAERDVSRAAARDVMPDVVVWPRSVKEVIRLRELKVISRREARRMMGLPVRWWRFGR